MVNDNNNTRKFDTVRFELSLEAGAYLGGTTNGVIIWNIYLELLNLLSLTNGKLVKRGIPIELLPGEIDCSVNSLRQKFGVGPKPMTKVVSRFVELGLIRITPSKLASIADMVSVVGWTDAGGYHEIERNSGEQIPAIRINNPDDSDDAQDEAFPSPQFQPLEEACNSDRKEEPIKPDVCPSLANEDMHPVTDKVEQNETGEQQQSDKQNAEYSPKDSEEVHETPSAHKNDTSYNIYPRVVSAERDSEETHSSSESDPPPPDGKPLSMTDIVSQMTGATSDFVIPAVISVPRIKAKPHDKHSWDNKPG